VDLEIIECFQQKNGYDCGVFTLGFTDYLSSQNGNPSKIFEKVDQEFVNKFRIDIFQLIKSTK
jgi:Ulp1 family protease